MKNRIFIFLCMLCILCEAAFCVPIGRNENEVKKNADPIIKQVIDAYNTNNYAKIAIIFGEIMFNEFPQKKFEKLREDIFPLYGKIKSARYMGFITQLDDSIIVYKSEAEKSELLIKLALSYENERVVIVGIWFE